MSSDDVSRVAADSMLFKRARSNGTYRYMELTTDGQAWRIYANKRQRMHKMWSRSYPGQPQVALLHAHDDGWIKIIPRELQVDEGL